MTAERDICLSCCLFQCEQCADERGDWLPGYERSCCCGRIDEHIDEDELHDDYEYVRDLMEQDYTGGRA